MTDERAEAFELRLERLLDAPCAAVWRCWTEPELLEQWFGPRSWTTEVKTLEVRPGGTSHIVMRGPNGELSDGTGVFLDAVPEQRLVFTNAFAPGWIPSSRPAVVPFMTTIVDMSDAGGRTRHVVRALHWSEEARTRHEEMGFHDGWTQATDRLEALVRTLRAGPRTSGARTGTTPTATRPSLRRMDPSIPADDATAPLELPGPVVSTGWLAEHRDDPRLVLVDASSTMNRADAAIPGALLLDLDGAFSDPSSELPHTMPSAKQLTAAARSLGIRRSSTVVAYDGQGLFAAARVWWMLRSAGFERVAVLDGGLPAWVAEGRPTGAHAAPPAEPGDVELVPRERFFVGADDVARALAAPDATVLDARSAGRFAGTEPEPRPGLRPGHMPGAVNLPYTELQGPDGRLLPLPQLRERIDAAAPRGHGVVTSCGSGITACVLALGAHLAGREDVAVYDGSWSEWGRPGPRPVVGPA